MRPQPVAQRDPIINRKSIYHPGDHHPPPDAAEDLPGRFDCCKNGSAAFERIRHGGLTVALNLVYNICENNVYKELHMAATRLALSMDESVANRARMLADSRNTSISKLFVSFICLMEQQKDYRQNELPPLTKKALGLARGIVSADWDYRDDLATELAGKYGES